MAPISEHWVQPMQMQKVSKVRILCGRDKSLTHRAVMFASLASGYSRIHEPLLGADCKSTMACFRELGVKIEVLDARRIGVLSQGHAHFKAPQNELDCGNSGTTARLILGILSAQQGLRFQLKGDESLSKRPMRRVVDPLRAMGASISGIEQGNLLPIIIDGMKLHAASHTVDKASAQVKSALLLAGLFCDGWTSVDLPLGSRDHTEKMLHHMGARIERNQSTSREIIRLWGPFNPPAGEYRIPVDPSSAAFFAIFGLLRGAATITLAEVLDNPTRTGFLKVLARMSRGITPEPSTQASFVEPVMDIHVAGGLELHGTDISAAEVPSLIDEIPILAVAAAFAKGPSRFRGLEELRVKESDRLNKTAELLHLAGAGVQIDGDDLCIQGGLKKAQSFRYNPSGDHRLAMAAAIMAKRGEKPSCILDPDCVEVSFPNFFEILASASGNEI